MKNYGCFTGIKSLDFVILSKFPDIELFNILKTSKYFMEFKNYDKLWINKIFENFGRISVDEYNSKITWYNYYIKLSRYSTLHVIPTSIINIKGKNKNFRNYYPIISESGENLSEIAIKYLKSIDVKIKYGDVVWFESAGFYRNVGKIIFDGTNFVNLTYKFDGYGSLPKTFKIFEIVDDKFIYHDYWKNTIDHNSLVWINLSQYKNLSICTYIGDNKCYMYTKICLNEIIYSILYIIDHGNQYIEPLESDYVLFRNELSKPLSLLTTDDIYINYEIKSNIIGIKLYIIPFY